MQESAARTSSAICVLAVGSAWVAGFFRWRADLSVRATTSSGRTWKVLADPWWATSGSVPETQARLLFAAYELPKPLTQFVVRAGGRFIARADFAWPAAKLVVELDGFGPHSGRDAFQRDRRRQNALVNEGWKVLRFTVDDISNDPWRVIHRGESFPAARLKGWRTGDRAA
jgi:hypothetical protein